MKKNKRIFLIVLDSVGIGYTKDAYKFGDTGANTLGNIRKKLGLEIPVLHELGFENLNPTNEVILEENPKAYHTYMKPKSVGKDSIAGHWEFMGCILKEPFKVFTKNGFPKELIYELEKRTGYRFIGNKEASGVKIIHELGMRQKKTKELIIYTSVDSTLQIAAHEEWIGLKELYRCCEIARELTKEKSEWKVARVIARPFIGDNNLFKRTGNRHDYAIKPVSHILLEDIKNNDYDVISIGKINDLYTGLGITKSIPTKNNFEGIEKLFEYQQKDFNGLLFLNLVDFDSIYGHPRDPHGYKKALEYFDEKLSAILKKSLDEDIIFITADHGNDPTFKGNDHTREYVPLIAYSKSFKKSKFLKPRDGFSDLGSTICELLEIKCTIGKSFARELI